MVPFPNEATPAQGLIRVSCFMFAACSKVPSRDNRRKMAQRRNYRPGCRLNPDFSVYLIDTKKHLNDYLGVRRDCNEQSESDVPSARNQLRDHSLHDGQSGWNSSHNGSRAGKQVC